MYGLFFAFCFLLFALIFLNFCKRRDCFEIRVQRIRAYSYTLHVTKYAVKHECPHRFFFFRARVHIASDEIVPYDTTSPFLPSYDIQNRGHTHLSLLERLLSEAGRASVS